MIDEQAEEMACLRALGLLDDDGDARLCRSAPPGSELERLARELAEAAARLAHAAAIPPPPHLRERVLSAAGRGSPPSPRR